MQVIDTILRKAKPVDKYNILCVAPTHERYESSLCQTGHNFYCLNIKNGPGLKQFWNTKHSPIPDNYTILPQIEGDKLEERIMACLPKNVTFDFVLSHQKFGQYQIARPVSNMLHIPMIQVEHTLPMPNWPQQQLQQCFNMQGDINVFITKFNRDAWGWSQADCEVLTHGVDTSIFNPGNLKRDNVILTVANDYINRDWCLGFQIYQAATKGLPTRPVGDTPGFSEAPQTLDELVKMYQTSTIFLNTATYSPVPSVLLEAAACGCAIVSLKSCACPDFIEHGVSGLLAESELEMRLYLTQLLKDEKLRRTLSSGALNMVQKKCSMQNFVDNWNRLFQKAFSL